MKRLDVIGIGQICVDYIGFVNRFPRLEERVEIENLSVLSGGPTATALGLLARFGMKVAIIGKVGDDREGTIAKTDLERKGVSTSYLTVEPGKRSQISLIPVDKQTGSRTVFWSRGTFSPLRWEEVPKEAIASARALHFDELHSEAIIKAAHFAKQSGVIVSFDAGDYDESMLEMKGCIDILIVSEDFIKRFCGGKSPREAIYKLKRFGAEVTTVTMSNRGSITLYRNEVIELPAYRVKAVDTTGTGDVFHGAFLFAWLNRYEIGEALRFASAAAAMNTLRLGASGGIPESPDEVKRFMNSHTLNHALDNE
ncbi:MAG: PfkB family carbohydrate kinase [Candidatus Methanosuratincola sp.]|jgi:ribokinase